MANFPVHIVCESIPSPLWLGNPDFSYQDTLELWKISIKDKLPEICLLQGILSEEERKRMERYHQTKDKIRFTIGRGMLRIIVARYLNCLPESLQFKKGLYNKPYVGNPADFHFNVSYSGDLVLIGVANEAIGVDIEYISSTLEYRELVEGVLSSEERCFLLSSPTPREEFLKLWTRKEALLKAVSRGLGDDLKNFSCLDGSQTVSQPEILKGDWKIKSFLLDSHYYVSLAYRHTPSFRYWNSHQIFLT